ncbi:MAG TPA: ABC transporter permease [Actinomycetota bacterium]|nr:ABC transporter permease [Actinomycetota bacterium]
MSAATLEVAPVRLAGGGWRDDARTIWVVWKRELIRFRRNRVRIVTSLAQPILFLFVLGTGLSSFVGSSRTSGIDYRTFVFPGVLTMTVLFTATFSAVSIVWDREFGFLREMLVAPARRGAIIVGKALGGATVATMQGCIMLALAGLVHIPYTIPLFAFLIGMMALAAFMLTAFGLMLASGIQQVESFQVVIQFFVMPMFFLAGALFPLAGLPLWLSFLTRIDPLAYAVDPMRRAVFRAVGVPAAAMAQLVPGISWFGWRVPTPLEVAIVAVLGVLLTVIAAFRFGRTE